MLTVPNPASFAFCVAVFTSYPTRFGNGDCPVANVTVIGVVFATSAPSAGLMETTLSLTDVGGSEVAATRVTFVNPAFVSAARTASLFWPVSPVGILSLAGPTLIVMVTSEPWLTWTPCTGFWSMTVFTVCLLYTSDAADEEDS